MLKRGTQPQGIFVCHLGNKSLIPKVTAPNTNPKTIKEDPYLTKVYPYKIIDIYLINQNGICFEKRDIFKLNMGLTK